MFNNGAYRNYTYAGQNIILEENFSKKHKLKNSKEFIYGNTPDDILYLELTEYKTRKEQEEYINAKGKTKTRNIKIAFTETNSYYYEKDHLGSILAISDDTGTILEEYRYDAFGQPYSKLPDGTVTSLKKSPIGNTRLYTGREYDRGLGLYYNRARYYNPILGRFISRDPIGIADDVNLYSYVKNNPVGFTDIFGLAAKTFVKAYDEYMDIKQFIYNRGTLDIRFRLLDNATRKSLLNDFEYKRDKARELHYKRNNFNIGLPESISEAYSNNWRRMLNSKSIYHSFGKNVNNYNAKFVSEDGKKEVVYDSSTGRIDYSDKNIGTYNFFSPTKEPEKHEKYDVYPYFEWGNTAFDNTSKYERILQTTEYIPAKAEEVNQTLDYKINNFSQANTVNFLINNLR